MNRHHGMSVTRRGTTQHLLQKPYSTPGRVTSKGTTSIRAITVYETTHLDARLTVRGWQKVKQA